MASSPHMQQMMLGMLPSALRRPEVLQQMFSDPDTKKKIAEMIAKRVRGAISTPCAPSRAAAVHAKHQC